MLAHEMIVAVFMLFWGKYYELDVVHATIEWFRWCYFHFKANSGRTLGPKLLDVMLLLTANENINAITNACKPTEYHCCMLLIRNEWKVKNHPKDVLVRVDCMFFNVLTMCHRYVMMSIKCALKPLFDDICTELKKIHRSFIVKWCFGVDVYALTWYFKLLLFHSFVGRS